MFHKNYEYPVQRADAAIRDLVPIEEHAVLTGARVLIADDERDAREMLSLALECCGAQVATAFSAEEAASLASRQKFDLIITDLAMPGGDGFSLLRRLRLRGDRTPAIALSAMRGHAIEMEVREAGFVQHVDKPIEMSFLAAAAADAIRVARAPRPT